MQHEDQIKQGVSARGEAEWGAKSCTSPACAKEMVRWWSGSSPSERAPGECIFFSFFLFSSFAQSFARMFPDARCGSVSGCVIYFRGTVSPFSHLVCFLFISVIIFIFSFFFFFCVAFYTKWKIKRTIMLTTGFNATEIELCWYLSG